MVSGRTASWDAPPTLVATPPESLFRNSLPHFVGADEQAEPPASKEVSRQYSFAHPWGSGATLPRSDDPPGAFSPLFEVVYRHRFWHRSLGCQIVFRAMPFGSSTTATSALRCSPPVTRSAVTLKIDPRRPSRMKMHCPSGVTGIWVGAASPSVTTRAGVSLRFLASTCHALSSCRVSWVV